MLVVGEYVQGKFLEDDSIYKFVNFLSFFSDQTLKGLGLHTLY
jgi:hypothetical protein